MPLRWQLWTDDERERRAFADLPAVRRWPAEPAGPPNRLRQVWRLSCDGGTYFLKCFAATQWKNRLAFALTAPRAADDADRERRVTAALRAAGCEAPRPIATGRQGRASFYLCAELPGTPCRDLLAQGAADEPLWRAVAAHCGVLLQRGLWLPDLSAEHVFARRDGGAWRLGVLDLHNGRVAAAGPVPTRLLRRVLRRFRRSVHDLPVGWPRALRFALRLLRAAGRRGEAARAVLAPLPPFATAARYQRPGKSGAYADRNPRRDARERRLLARVWPGRRGETVLDLPCGAGRLHGWLTGLGHAVVQADGAVAMLREARARGAGAERAVLADALSMPFADRAVDGVVMFRFLHHLAPAARTRAIAEACRTARRFVTVSFFHPCSAHHLQRWLRAARGGRTTRFALTLGALRAEFARHGFTPTAHAADLPFARDLWLASFERATGTVR
ncbi:MAG: methyltransferase domain-containing protein [Planctomycetes bacterium]|nr:methyltransferase domain-containing protein [Planctomycetota bacterium]